MTMGPWKCDECNGHGCDVCVEGKRRCDICPPAMGAVAIVPVGPTEVACATCGAFVQELEVRWSDDDMATTSEDLQPVTMRELVLSRYRPLTGGDELPLPAGEVFGFTDKEGR
jgi:hypothetical protein